MFLTIILGMVFGAFCQEYMKHTVRISLFHELNVIYKTKYGWRMKAKSLMLQINFRVHYMIMFIALGLIQEELHTEVETSLVTTFSELVHTLTLGTLDIT